MFFSHFALGEIIALNKQNEPQESEMLFALKNEFKLALFEEIKNKKNNIYNDKGIQNQLWFINSLGIKKNNCIRINDISFSCRVTIYNKGNTKNSKNIQLTLIYIENWMSEITNK